MARRRSPPRRPPRRPFLTGLSGIAVLVLLAALAHLAQVLQGGSLSGMVSHVRDGDTIEVGGTPVRLANLDCAELGTRAGEAARERMAALVRGERLACRLEGRRSHDREIGTCALEGTGRDLGEVLIGEGTCDRWR